MQRLSQNAIAFGSQAKRQVNSGLTWWVKRKTNNGALSSSVMPVMPAVCATFTNRALRPVSGWVRTNGCSARYSSGVASLPSDLMRSSLVFDTSALAELLMPTKSSSRSFMVLDSDS